jgi:hypothetical protein
VGRFASASTSGISAPNGASTAVLKTRRGIVEEIGIGDEALTSGHKAQRAFSTASPDH